MHKILIAIAFNVADIITGLILAVKTKDIQSSKLRDGLFKKTGFLVIYTMAYLLENYGAEIGFSIGVPVVGAVVSYSCLTELVSILENVSRINPELLPEKLMKLFHISGGEDNG